MKNSLTIQSKIILLLLGSIFLLANVSLSQTPRQLPSRLFGLTVDDIDDIDSTVKTIKKIKADAVNQKPIVRIVFDFNEEVFKNERFHYEEADFKAEAERYKKAVEKLYSHAFVVGLLIDSSALYRNRYDSRRRTNTVVERTKAYARTLGNLIDIWEIGNEINGEWVGWREGKEGFLEPMVTLEQLKAARELAADETMQSFIELKKILPDAKTAVTFYYNDDGKNIGWTDDKKLDADGNIVFYGNHYSMTTWAREQRPKMPDVDYVWLSYYEDDNKDVRPNRNDMDVSGLIKVLIEMSELFKTAQIGFGEFAPQCNYKSCNERKCADCISDQPLYIKNYYIELDKKIRAALSNPKSNWDKNRNYCGGYFYWYFNQDAVENNNMGTVKALRDAFGSWYGK